MGLILGVFSNTLHAEECVCTPEGECTQDGRPVESCLSSDKQPSQEPQEERPPEPKEAGDKGKRQGPRLVIHAAGNRARAALAPRPSRPLMPPPGKPPKPPGQGPPGPQPSPPSQNAPLGKPSEDSSKPPPDKEPSDKPQREPPTAPLNNLENQDDFSRFSTPVMGLSAGCQAFQHGFWTTTMASALESSEDSEKYEGAMLMGLVGLDHKITENLLGGLSLGYEWVDLDANANANAFISKGVSVTPYVAVVLFDNLTLDALFGYAVLFNEVKEASDTGSASGIYRSQRTLASANLNYYMLWDSWNLSAQAGYMHVNEDQEAYQLIDGGMSERVEQANSYMGEWRLGARVGYFWGDVEPYLESAYLYDNTWNDDGEDRDEIEVALGLDYYPSDDFIFSITAANSYLRDDVGNTRLMLNLRFEF